MFHVFLAQGAVQKKTKILQMKQFLFPEELYEEDTGINSGETSGYPKLNRKVSTEGFMEPLNTLNRRNLILKRMRVRGSAY